MTDLNTYLQDLENQLKNLDGELEQLETKKESLSSENLKSLEVIASEVKQKYTDYEMSSADQYPVSSENIEVRLEHVQLVINKLFKLD